MFPNTLFFNRKMYEIRDANMMKQQHKAAGADGPKWAGAVTPIIGGKAGGKPGAQTAIGQGTNADKVDAGVEEATKFIEGLKI
jgi:alanyl-tRNA synthetase